MSIEKRLPDAPGCWFNEDGLECCLAFDSTTWTIVVGGKTWHYVRLENALGHHVRPGRWKKAVRPEFEKIEPRPPMCYCVYDCGSTSSRRPAWRFIHDHMAPFNAKLIIVNHPDNDPEAIELIEKARSERGTRHC